MTNSTETNVTHLASPSTSTSATSSVGCEGPATEPPLRSCNTCHSRKVRCDKKQPCSPCVRVGKTCQYPARGPRPRRTRRTIMADMSSRIKSLEATITAAQERFNQNEAFGSPETKTRGSEPSTGPAANATVQYASPNKGEQGILIQEGSSSQYFNEVLLSRVIGHERTIETALTTPGDDDSSMYHTPSPYNPMGILSSCNLSQHPSVFHPPKAIAHQLWGKYMQAEEDSVFNRILHRPTDELKVYSAMDNPKSAHFDALALCFATFFIMLICMTDAEAGIIGVGDRPTQILAFKNGFEQSIAHANFLDRPTITGLQALAIYLSALKMQNRSKGIWILQGLAVRIAQSLGLHRDGQYLGLSPFQTEVRRRIWWCLIVRDGRSGEDYGLQDTQFWVSQSSVNLPSNVEDSDLFPEMKEPPTPRKGWTSMTFSIAQIHVVECIHKLDALSASASPSNPPSEETRRRIIQEMREKVEPVMAHSSRLIPRQYFGLICSQFIMRKVDFFTRQQWSLLRNPNSHEEIATEENLIEAIEILEGETCDMRHEAHSLYARSARAYPQYHMALYILWHLYLKPIGPNTERAWGVVKNTFDHEIGHNIVDGFNPKFVALKALKAKVEASRDRIMQQSRPVEAAAPAAGAALAAFTWGSAEGTWANQTFFENYELPDFFMTDGF